MQEKDTDRKYKKENKKRVRALQNLGQTQVLVSARRFMIPCTVSAGIFATPFL